MSTEPTLHRSASTPSAAHGGKTVGRREKLLRGVTGGAVLLAGGLAWWWLSTHHFTGGPAEHPPAVPAGGAAATDTPPEAAVVTLPPDAARDIVLVTSGTRTVREQLTVSGRLDYDARYRLSYESPVDGIVSRVFVKVRQKVAKGDPLAEVSSPEVGTARDDVRRREADREIQRKAAEWAATIAGNVEELLSALASHPRLEDVEARFRDRVLGAYREKIVAPYSRLLFVEKVSASTQRLGEGGVLSGRLVEERTSNLEVARASFEAACEEARFDTRQDRDRARAALDQAERLLQVSRENLRTLVGSRLEADTAGVVAADGEESPGESGGLSTLVLRTPFDGVVEEIFMSRGERVKAGDKLFVVADTTTLWVRAQVNERQWTQVELEEGQEVEVRLADGSHKPVTARINHVAATVEPESRSVPLIAELRNEDVHYKPGMLVAVDLPVGPPREALTLPSGTVMENDGQTFVFVPAGAGEFLRVDVKTGIEDDGYVEVTAGLEAGAKVVGPDSAPRLKSKLLLKQEG